MIRPTGPADLAALSDFFAGLSVESSYLRFFAPVTPGGGLLHLLSGSPANVDAIVAVAGGIIVGHAMAADGSEDPCGSRVTDVGVVVADAWQRRGVGAALMRALTIRAQARGVTSLVMDVLPGNRPTGRIRSLATPRTASTSASRCRGTSRRRSRSRGPPASRSGRWSRSGDSIRA